jgi:flagellar biosynthesis/type III secretory pathway protein FliH
MSREMESEVFNLCNIGEGFEERGYENGLKKGLEQGLEQGLLTAIQNIMSALSMNVDQAMSILKVPVEERSFYRDKLLHK